MVAAGVCLTGSILTVRLSLRLRKMALRARKVQIALTAIVAGGMIWATHFIAMLAYDPGVDHGYEPVMTAVSLIIAILGAAVALTIASKRFHRFAPEIGGAIFGLTIATMHYLGMSAFLVPGEIIWEMDLLIASILLGVGLGALSFNRVVRPVTRYCWLGGALTMLLSICSMHFTGMTAITIVLDPTVSIPPSPLSDAALALVVLGLVMFIMLMGLTAFMIEAHLAQDARHRLQEMALTDPLTNLPNRQKLRLEIGTMTAQGNGRFDGIAILTLDLNLFKQINDLHGHNAGDTVLIAIAERMLSVVEDGEFIARTGGDEFVAVKPNITGLEDAFEFAQRLRTQILRPIAHHDLRLQLGVSIGLSCAPQDGTDLALIQEYSDIAMYRAKRLEDSGIIAFRTEMYADDRARTAIKADLRVAVTEQQFELHYQLQNDIRTHEPVGFEALIRWNHPTKGRINPDDFIPIAEETGIICEIGSWVLRTACEEAASWGRPYRIAVNVAPQQMLQPGFAEQVADALDRSDLNSDRLELEITEASVIRDHAITRSVIHQIKSLGVRVAMDDFGTGYSSLATLQAFPFDKIKIDKSFVAGVHQDSKRAAIIRATIMMAKAMNIPVLAEGVEDADELEFLLFENCAEVQGYYFGRPMDRDQMRRIAVPTKAQQRKAS
jgi:diguanylate cyclase (GGDEF)-like protein